MKTYLLGGFFVEQRNDNFTLKKTYPGIRGGQKVECEKILSHHPTFESAAEAFLRLYQGDKTNNEFKSLKEYIKALNKANAEAIAAVKESKMERFYINVPVGRGQTKDANTIVSLIPVGRENAISRKVLLQLCVGHGLINKDLKDKDRVMRELIQKARIDYTILNLSDGNGYYRVSRDDLQDLQRYIRQEEKRAKSTFKNLSMAKKLYEDYKSGRL